MPSARLAAREAGVAERCCSSRAIERPEPVDTHAPIERTSSSTANEDCRRMSGLLLLAVRVEHVLEAHPLLVEIQVHISRAAVAILAHEQLGGALDATSGVIHPLAKEREHHVGALLHGAASAEVVHSGTEILTRPEMRQGRRHQDGGARIERETLERTDRGALLLLGVAQAWQQRIQAVDDYELDGAKRGELVG